MPGPSDPLGIDVSSNEGLAVRLILEGKNHLPIRVVYFGADRIVTTTTFSDRRSNGGLKVPCSIVTTVGERIIDEMIFDEIAINPSLNKADFSR